MDALQTTYPHTAIITTLQVPVTIRRRTTLEYQCPRPVGRLTSLYLTMSNHGGQILSFFYTHHFWSYPNVNKDFWMGYFIGGIHGNQYCLNKAVARMIINVHPAFCRSVTVCWNWLHWHTCSSYSIKHFTRIL